ncbi:Cyclin/Brf1-like TBP-binding protein [Zea mays]|uniref:Cyclin/Brf1-like TBP-binding protein n=1 Tax=Zea mays TaxID=4577 RepID=A0A1D6FJC5_MAIZE|nr:Cyclin/Brf1-like TBP-binding protein [Zea mays]
MIVKSRGVKRTCGGMKEMSGMGTEKTSGLGAHIACECFVPWMGLSSRLELNRKSTQSFTDWYELITPGCVVPSAMIYCTHCADYCPSIKDPDKGYICCGTCGKVLDQEVYTDEPTFVKDNTGQSRLAGSILASIESGYSISHQRTLDKGRDEIRQIVNNLHLAVDRNFTRGRRTSHVAAACLYIACRQSKKAYLLIDFSDYLQISVYVLGAVFLQLCQVLLLADHPVVQKLVDPSLFIHRFTKCLLGRRDNAVSDTAFSREVSDTALRIVASMKRDWMQADISSFTGRKPSGLCGAALYIAALSHGCNYTKADIVSVVHVCEATLTKRLIEFENTDSGSLTIEEFLATADEYNEASVSKYSPKSGEILCKHKGKDFEHFAHGLCEKCFNKFTKLSGGLEGGANPPAFQRAENKRLEAAKRAEEAAAVKEAALEESLCDTQNSEIESTTTPKKALSGDKSSTIGSGGLINDSVPPKDPEEGGENCEGNADPESLSDIDDVEVDWYLHNEEETQYKKIIWEEMNKEYLEEQAAKEALAAELAARGIVVEEGKKTKDEVESASRKEEMEFDALFGPDNADGETVDDGGYGYGGCGDGGAEAYNGIDDDFDF